MNKDLVIEAGKNKSVSVYRERPATKAERAKDPNAKIMAEWVHIIFGGREPKIVVNRNLSA